MKTLYKICFFFALLITSLHAAESDYLFSFGTSNQGNGQFSQPDGVAVYGEEVFVADSGNDRVQVFDKAGNFLRKWGENGNKAGQFSNPGDIAVYEGEVFVVDQNNNRVQVFDTSGNFLRQWTRDFFGEFRPAGMAVFEGEVYITDTLNDGIHVFDTKGTFLRYWSAIEPSSIVVNKYHVCVSSKDSFMMIFDRKGRLIREWNNEDDDLFRRSPNHITFYQGRIYACDEYDSRILCYNLDGKLKKTFEIKGHPIGITIRQDEIFVTSEDQVFVYNLEGHFLRKWGTSKTKEGELNRPTNIAVEGEEVYVLDTGNHRVQVFDQLGNFLRKWGAKGEEEGEFDFPFGIAVEKSKVFIADTFNNRIQVFDKMGNFVTQWGEEGDDEGEFDFPVSIAVDQGEVYVADVENKRIQVFNQSGKFLREWEVICEGIRSIAVHAGRVYLTDVESHLIKIYDTSGDLLDEFLHDNFFPWGLAVHQESLFAIDADTVQILDLSGNLAGKLENKEVIGNPYGLAVNDHLIYITDTKKDKVHVFSNPSGQAPLCGFFQTSK